MFPVEQKCHNQTCRASQPRRDTQPHRDSRSRILFEDRTGRRSLAITLFLIFLASLMPFLMACQSQSVAASDSAGIRFVDDLGQEMILPDRPEHVVSLTGSFAETWLLAGGTLAGVTSDAWSERQLDLPSTVVDLGNLKEPNIERLLALSPDLVILSTEIDSHRKMDQRLKDLGIPHASFRVEHFSDYLNMLRISTDLTGRQDLYQKNGLDVQVRADSVLKGFKAERKPSVLLIRAFSTGVKVRKDDNMTGKMLAEFGCDNIALHQDSLLDNLSIETIIDEDPDYILVETMGADTDKALSALEKGLKASPAWNQLSAVRNQHFIVLPKDLFHYKPNAKWDEAYAYLAKIFNQ